MCRAHIIVYEALMEDSIDQIFGFSHVGDGSGSTTAHVTTWNPIDFARLMKWGEVNIGGLDTHFFVVLLHNKYFSYLYVFCVVLP